MLGALGALTPVAAHDPITTKITFDREIRAILQARCATCHGRGGLAPMPLTTYEEVRPWARAIKDQVLTRRMPIWHAAHGYGAFASDPSLTPAEMGIVASWVDGGMPKTGSRGSTGSTDSLSPSSVVSAFRRKNTIAVSIPAAATETTGRLTARWVAGWDVQPGDPLITSATFTSADGSPIGTWVAGDAAIVLPANAAIRITSPVRIALQRRKAADYEKPFTTKRSVVRLLTRGTPPQRRVWIEQTTCGTARTGRTAEMLAVRPLLDDGASARVWLERPGAARTIVGWFRDYDSRYPRTYWLARAADLPPESRVQADAACTIELTLALSRLEYERRR